MRIGYSGNRTIFRGRRGANTNGFDYKIFITFERVVSSSANPQKINGLKPSRKMICGSCVRDRGDSLVGWVKITQSTPGHVIEVVFREDVKFNDVTELWAS